MNKDLNNTAVKIESEAHRKAANALFKAKGYEFLDNKEIDPLYVAASNAFAGVYSEYKAVPPNYKVITLDQLTWDYGLADDECKYCILDESNKVYFTESENMSSGSTLISTRPKQTLQNGDYLPVSEIKTEQDFNDVVKAAENCGFEIYLERSYKEFQNAKTAYAYEVWGGELLLCGFNDLNSRNKLTLTQWLERGGVKRKLPTKEELYKQLGESEKETTKRLVDALNEELDKRIEESKGWLPEIGEECMVFNYAFEENAEWEKCTPLFLGKHSVVYDSESANERRASVDDVKFKPLPAPEEVEREEFVKRALKQQMPNCNPIGWVGEKDAATWYGDLFDAGCRFKD